MTQGVVSGPTCKKRKTAGQTTQLTFQGCIDATAVDVTFFLTLQPLSLQEDALSFQYLHWAAMEVTVTVALIDLMPGSTMGLMTR